MPGGEESKPGAYPVGGQASAQRRQSSASIDQDAQKLETSTSALDEPSMPGFSCPRYTAGQGGCWPHPPHQALPCTRHRPTYHVHRAEHMAVVVAGLQVLGDVGKGAEVLGVLRRT